MSLIFILAIPTSESPASALPFRCYDLAENLFGPAIVMPVVVADQEATFSLLGNQMSVDPPAPHLAEHDVSNLVVILLPISCHNPTGWEDWCHAGAEAFHSACAGLLQFHLKSLVFIEHLLLFWAKGHDR